MDDEPNSEGHYGRQVECTWVAHAFKNYEDLGQLVNCNSASFDIFKNLNLRSNIQLLFLFLSTILVLSW